MSWLHEQGTVTFENLHVSFPTRRSKSVVRSWAVWFEEGVLDKLKFENLARILYVAFNLRWKA
jgi:hypothetical protein